MYNFTSTFHLKTILKGLEAAIILIIGIRMYDALKDLEIDLIKHSELPVSYHKLVTHILHFLSIFAAEVILVYILTIIFETDF
jgi:hypothetical protein